MIVLVLILALILRIIALNQSLWLDEAIQVWASSAFSLKELLSNYLPGDFNPPFYHLLLHFWIRLFGTSEIAVRMLSVIFSLGAIYLLWKIGLKITKQEKTALMASLLLATSPLHLYYSQEARMYMLASLAVLLAVFRFLLFLEKQTWKNNLLFALSLLLMVYSHFLTAFLIPIFFFFLLKKKPISKIAVPFLILILGYLPYLPLFFKQLATGIEIKTIFPVWGKTVGAFTFKAAALLPIKFIIGRVSIANKIAYGLSSLFLVFVYWGLAFWGSLKKKIVFSLLFLPPFLAFLLSFFLPVFSYFRFLFLLPFFYLAIALAKPRKWLFLGLILINLFFSCLYLFRPQFHRENWRQVANWIYQENKSQAPVMILGQVFQPFKYYDQGKSQLVLAETRDEEQLANLKEIFLISYGLPIFDPEDTIRGSLRKQGFELRKGDSFNQVGIENWLKIKDKDDAR